MRPDNKRFTRCISARKRAGKAHDNSAYRAEKNKPQGPIATDRKRKRTDHATQDAWEHRLRSQTNQKMTSDCAYSHSIVAGGLPEMSYTTRLMPRTSLMMRLETRPSNSCGRCAQCAVIKSCVCTARKATTYS